MNRKSHSPSAVVVSPFARSHWRRIFCSLLVAIAVIDICRAHGAVIDPTQSIAAFDAANKLYEQGRFAEAARSYQQLIGSGVVSVPVYFNLGNAFYKDGQIGRSIAAYRQAERLAPRDPNVQFNLNFARKRVSSGEPPAGPVGERVVNALTVNEWTALAAGAFWIALLLLAVGELRESFRATARRYALLVAIAAALLGTGVAAAARQRLQPSQGVIVMTEALIRSGPLDEGRVLHHFRDGTEVKLLDQKQVGPDSSWFLVRNSGGDSGWVRNDQVTVIR
jgi:tetratricopeptide (TPR) repeat protein